MTDKITPLEFEKPIYQIKDKIEELKALSAESGMNLEEQIITLTKQAEDFKKELYCNLTPSQKIQIARHPKRPNFTDYVNLITEDWIELHGDRAGSDDKAIVGGVATIDGRSVMLIGTHKGKTTKENLKYNFGMPTPEGYRKALRLFYHADRFNLPIINLIDTPGAYPGIKAEQTGQGIAIAVNLREMAKLSTPIIAVITGEGCSGGALGLAVANRVHMLEHSYYTVISPEGCASILYKDASMANKSAEILKITSEDLTRLDVIDETIKEPLGGAHYNHEEMGKNIKAVIVKSIDELSKMSGAKLKKDRQEKFRKIGVFNS